jgi:hypothetical protein
VSGKPRVHELAKELRVSAKEVLVWLKEQGLFVKSASSTVERPVARRLREEYQAKNPANPVTTSPVGLAISRPDDLRPAARCLTSFQAASACRRFRQASASGQDQATINRLYSECVAQYGVS